MIVSDFRIEVERIVDIIKPNRKAGSYKSAIPRDESEDKEIYPGYLRNLNEAKENTVHSKGVYPALMLGEIAPNQTEEDAAYIRKTYQCVTKNTFQNFSNTVKRAFLNGLVEWPFATGENETLDAFKDYLETGIPQYGSFGFFMSNLAEEKLNDANGICAVLPTFETTEGEDESDETITEVKPVPTIYNTERVFYNTGDEYIVESFEKSEVTVADKKVQEGVVFLAFTDTKIYWARQTGKFEDWNFKFEEWDHEIGFVPAVRLFGSPFLVEDKLSFTSPFFAAVPNLNLAVLDSVNLLVIKRKVTYPTRVFIAETCQHQESGTTCNNGVLRISDGKSPVYEKPCGQCRGTGKIGVFGPNSELMLNAAAFGENQIKASDAMTYVAPPVETPKFLREEIDGFITTAEQILFLKAEPRGSGDITATEKSINALNTEALIKPISDQLTFIQKYLIETMGLMKYDDDVFKDIRPKIKAPQTFDVLTDADYLQRLNEATTAGAPKIVLDRLLWDYLRSANFTDTQSEQVFRLLEVSDPLLTVSNDEIAFGLSRGTIKKEDAVIHQIGLSLIMELILADPKFLSKELKDQKLALKTASLAAVPVTAVELPPAEEIE